MSLESIQKKVQHFEQKDSATELMVKTIPDSLEMGSINYPELINKFSENNIKKENLELRQKTEADQMNIIRQQLGLPPLEDLTSAQININREINNLNEEQNEILTNLGITQNEYNELIIQIEQKIKRERIHNLVRFFKKLSPQEQTYITYHGTLLNGLPVQVSGISFPTHDFIKKYFMFSRNIILVRFKQKEMRI